MKGFVVGLLILFGAETGITAIAEPQAAPNRSVGELFDRIRNSMPQDEPGPLSPQRTAEIVAYILSANELPAGNRALGEEVESLTQIRMDAGQP